MLSVAVTGMYLIVHNDISAEGAVDLAHPIALKKNIINNPAIDSAELSRGASSPGRSVAKATVMAVAIGIRKPPSCNLTCASTASQQMTAETATDTAPSSTCTNHQHEADSCDGYARSCHHQWVYANKGGR